MSDTKKQIVPPTIEEIVPPTREEINHMSDIYDDGFWFYTMVDMGNYDLVECDVFEHEPSFTPKIRKDVDLEELKQKIRDFLDGLKNVFFHSKSRMSLTVPEWMTEYTNQRPPLPLLF